MTLRLGEADGQAKNATCTAQLDSVCVAEVYANMTAR